MALVAVIGAAGLGAVVAGAAPASAVEACGATWVGPAGGDWAQASNWSPAEVPTFRTTTCLPAGSSPTVLAGEREVAGFLVMTDSALQIDGELNAGTFNLTDSDLSGAGTLDNHFDENSLSGVQVSGSLRIRTTNSVTVTGSRSMCGSQLSLCLSGGSRLVIGGGLELINAVIGGDTTARPAVRTGVVTFAGRDFSDRVEVDLDAPAINGRYSPSTTLRIDRWEQLSARGALTANVQFADSSTLIVPRAISSITAGVVYLPQGDTVRTPDGADALTGLSSVAVYGRLTPPASVTPRGGTVTIQPGQSQGAPSVKRLALTATTPSTVHGTIVNQAAIDVRGAISADAVVNNVDMSLKDGAAIAAAVVDLAAGRTALDGHVGISASNGIRVNSNLVADARSTCAALAGDVTFTAAARAATTLGAPAAGCSALYAVSGAATLAGTLALTTAASTPVGTTVVLVDAAGGLTGRFTRVTGQDDGNGNHWSIGYTGSQVVATLVAG